MLYRSGINRKLNIDIIYNNINTTRIEQLSQEDKPFLPFDLTNNRVIGFVGNLSLKVKGIENLIIAFSELKKIIDNVRLLLVGEGADKEEILKLCEKYLISDDVFFLGFQKNPIKFMKLFDLLVLPSNSEAFGYVLLESIYVGTPAIGSRVGGIPEVLKYEELLFEPNDWNSLYEKLKNILCCDEEYKKVKDLCIKRKDFFTFNWCEKMEESINRTLLN